MKKIIALLLVVAMMSCMFVGCGKKDDVPEKDPTENVQVEKPEDTKPEEKPDESKPSEEVTEPSEEDTKPSEDKQALYEDVFMNAKFKVASESFKMNAADLIKSTLLVDKNNVVFYEMAGSVDGEEIGVALLIKDTNDVYMHQFGTEDGVAVDQWFKCTIAEGTENDADETIDGVATTEEFTGVIGDVNKVEFVESVDGLDKVILYAPVPESEYEMPELAVDMTVEVEYNGAKGTYRYQEYATGGSGYSSTNGIDGFSFGDYEFDAEKLTLTKDDEVIQCTLITNHLENPVELATEIKIEVLIDPATYAIHKMVMTDETSAVSTIEFIDCEDVLAEVELPENMEEMPLEEAMMTFVMVMLGLAFSGMQ